MEYIGGGLIRQTHGIWNIAKAFDNIASEP